MNLFMRGFFSVVRKPRKNLLLLIILTTISLLLLIAVGIHGQQELMQREMMNQLGGGFTLELNPDFDAPRYGADGTQVRFEIIANPETGGTMNFQDRPTTISAEDIRQVSAIEGISTTNILSRGIFMEPEGFYNDQTHVVQGSRHNPLSDDRVRVTGVKDLASVNDVVNGFISLKEGRWITEADRESPKIPLVVSEQIVQKNGLGLGEKLSFNWQDLEADFALEHFGTDRIEKLEITGEIVGIFTVEQPVRVSSNASSLENNIFSKLDFWKDLFDGTRYGSYAYWFATFEVDDLSRYEEVRDQILELDLNWSRYELIDANTLFERLSPNLSGLETISTLIFYAALAAGLGMLMLVFILWIRNRHQELAIFLALGISKPQIVTQFIFEAALIAVIAFPVALVSLPLVGNWMDTGELAANFSQDVSHTVLIDGIEVPIINQDLGETSESAMTDTFYEMATSSLRVTPASSLMVFASLMGLISFSIPISLFPLLRMKPKEIFSKS